ncbi:MULTISPECIES: sigma factor-like helix-turn-helix DNA-binding protein [unclassified Streptomyces]|uniref:sigma factor-like helix-turn-helix DNA-binding protein n=1 Tax=unclassified Streptomyces TaxID=2593676 RepID=UPI002476157B|nr:MULTISPECIES: sigma factor-like helix-turn-helix DNA-binding protein [unclassified Streptomyces]MDH6454945.1 RNA polymerase sigma factor (sigma-70 family) [Streptomyces sp. SAI-119]MDH6494501.1 RNA polymerase sigma factor (sigma-70 family) [Streptomyces sp. SAI-149]
MNGTELSAECFRAHRARLRAVAYRMLGSLDDADEAVQETWLRLSDSGSGGSGGSGASDAGVPLVTVVGAVCLDRLRSRAARRAEAFVPDPVIAPLSPTDPEQEALYADAAGLALMAALEDLTPAQRLALVLHDMFAVPFDDIASILERSPGAARQLAGRARRRMRGTVPASEPDPGRQREVLEAFLAAARAGDVETLLAVLHPDVVLRADSGAASSRVVRGAREVAAQVLRFRRFTEYARLALVNGEIGVVNVPEGRPLSVAGVTVADGTIVGLNVLADPDRLARLRLPGTAR